jgi:hypothetical protein
MEVYRRETDDIMSRFLSGKLTREQCLAALYNAFTRVLPQIGSRDIPTMRAIVKANDETIQRELWRRRGGVQVVN